MLPFDISILRENVDNDRETEHALLEIFVESVAESIQSAHDLWPETIMTAKGQDEWRHHLHRIKGAAMNLGADDLTEAARLGEQKAYNTPDFEKQDQLMRVEEAYQTVVEYIEQLLKQ